VRVGVKITLVFLIAVALFNAGCCSTTNQTSTVTQTTITPLPTPTVETTISTVSVPVERIDTVTVATTPVSVYTQSGNTGGAGTLKISVLDVGQGDSILIQTPNGKAMLVDAGDSDAGSRIVSILRSRGV